MNEIFSTVTKQLQLLRESEAEQRLWQTLWGHFEHGGAGAVKSWLGELIQKLDHGASIAPGDGPGKAGSDQALIDPGAPSGAAAPRKTAALKKDILPTRNDTPALSRPCWRLEAVTLRNFRGINKEHTFSFHGLSGLLHGDNGMGKSTLAQGIQWTLYGRFPPGVLANRFYDRFLLPVEPSAASCSGLIILVCRAERLIIERDEGGGVFSLTLGATTYEGPAAEKKRDELLQLDMDTFVRAVLLQQARIRGLLLDDPRERNRALDSLLGIDRLEELNGLINTKEVGRAAARRRQQIEVEQHRYTAQAALLEEQRLQAEARALKLGFTRSDFNPAGLRAAYAKVGAGLGVLAHKHELRVDPLPTCAAVREARPLARKLQQARQKIRQASTFHQQLGRQEAALGQLLALLAQWTPAQKKRDEARLALEAVGGPGASAESLAEQRATLIGERDRLQHELKQTDTLRQLLVEAAQVVAHQITTPDSAQRCPVCEQQIDTAAQLVSRLEERSRTLTTATLSALDERLRQLEQTLASVNRQQDAYQQAMARLAELEQALAACQQKIAQQLKAPGLVEKRVETRLQELIATQRQEVHELRHGAEHLEKELAQLEHQERAISEGLLPVLEKREEQRALEEGWAKAQQAKKLDEDQAQHLDLLAAQLDRLRGSLLAAKHELAEQCLEQAGPRAMVLYRRLVRHAVFDMLEIGTKSSKQKIDYLFQVSRARCPETAREARLVLSDGQLTATAMSLLFALAESAQHALEVLYVDDPTQSLDQAGREAMAQVIVELARRRQVIVTSHDEDFVEQLKAHGFGEQEVVHHFISWDGQPVVQTAIPTPASPPAVTPEDQLSLFAGSGSSPEGGQ